MIFLIIFWSSLLITLDIIENKRHFPLQTGFRQEELKSMHSKTYLGDDFCSNSGGSAHVHLRVDDLRDGNFTHD